MLIDEWQHHPPVWDGVRRAVDRHDPPGPFLLTGSVAPKGTGVHTGAGRTNVALGIEAQGFSAACGLQPLAARAASPA